MTLLHDLGERVGRADWVQLSILFFGALLFILFVTWPSRPGEAHNGWYALSQARMGGLALLALGYGTFMAASPQRERRATLLALLALALLSSPLEVAAYALSYPAPPLGYLLALAVLDSAALFGIGLLLGRVVRWLHLGLLLPLVGPAALVGLVFLDSALGLNLVNPLAALSVVGFIHLGLMALAALLTAWSLSRPEGKEVPR